MVSYWTFDDGTAVDTFGSNDGINYGATATTGQVEQSLDFDGVGDYLVVGDSDSLDMPKITTISAWVKTSDIGRQTIISKHWTDYEIAVDDPYIYIWYGGGGSFEYLSFNGFTEDGD